LNVVETYLGKAVTSDEVLYMKRKGVFGLCRL